ncbi:signal peptidase I [Terracoccus sp. 273MFTsu3.1]|uniref:signal peptidase I n=1 Tax=Terracoccus sp. 273MFTsu3.1 TaxID=1172188 RepID=UPI0003742180|nr:signal peptidase I [Terracoccus sp. 273MFTsu3.1]
MGRTLAVLAVGLAVGSHWVVEPIRVSSDSMSPTLSPGDHVVLLRTPWAGTVSRGDVVVVGPGWADRAAATTNAGAAQVPTGTSWVKRVVAVGGDVVGLEDGRLVVDGVPVTEPWVDEESMDGVWFGPVAVPAGAVFLMGDDRARSVDSRALGPALLDELDGRVVTPWPLS